MKNQAKPSNVRTKPNITNFNQFQKVTSTYISSISWRLWIVVSFASDFWLCLLECRVLEFVLVRLFNVQHLTNCERENGIRYVCACKNHVLHRQRWKVKWYDCQIVHIWRLYLNGWNQALLTFTTCIREAFKKLFCCAIWRSMSLKIL